jgi:1-phosphofructokinase family hexose kinase
MTVDRGRRHPARSHGRIFAVAPTPAIDRLLEVDRLTVGGITRPRSVVAVPGGKGLNVARAAAALGAPVIAVAFLAGHAGRWVLDGLERRAIECRVVWVKGETRICVSIHDRSTGELTELYEPPTAVPGDAWEGVERQIRAGLEAGDVLTISGGLPPSSPPDAYARLVRAAEDAGAFSVVDAYSRGLVEALPRRPTIVKLNAAEVAEIVGKPVRGADEAVAAAGALVDRGAAAAIVTLGIEGAVGRSGRGTWRIGPPPERGPFPVGSGDAFTAGLAVALGRGDGAADGARLGAAAAAANAAIPGAGELDPATVERLYEMIDLEDDGAA